MKMVNKKKRKKHQSNKTAHHCTMAFHEDQIILRRIGISFTRTKLHCTPLHNGISFTRTKLHCTALHNRIGISFTRIELHQ